MSDNVLPDELLEKVLALHFALDPPWPLRYRDIDSHGDTSNSAPVRKYAAVRGKELRRAARSRDTSPLRVCKRWWRVGLPLLYAVVAPGSPHQAYRLATTLKARRELGAAIRCLFLQCIDHSSPLEVYAIARRAPYVQVLALDLSVNCAHDRVRPLREALPFLSPETLVLMSNSHFQAQEKTEALLRAVELCLTTRWSALKHVVLVDIMATPAMVESLMHLPHLEELWILGQKRWHSWTEGTRDVPAAVVRIAQNPALRVLCFYDTADFFSWQQASVLDPGGELRRGDPDAREAMSRYRSILKIVHSPYHEGNVTFPARSCEAPGCHWKPYRQY